MNRVYIVNIDRDTSSAAKDKEGVEFDSKKFNNYTLKNI